MIAFLERSTFQLKTAIFNRINHFIKFCLLITTEICYIYIFLEHCLSLFHCCYSGIPTLQNGSKIV